MYRQFIEKRIRLVFKNLSEEKFEELLKDFSPHFVHYFPGAHALGGIRRDLASMRRWFARLSTLFPHLRFEIKNILVRGWPWNTIIAIEWVDRTTLPDGNPYENQGTHWLRLRWGKLVELRAYLDSQKIADALKHLADLGIQEAREKPIE